MGALLRVSLQDHMCAVEWNELITSFAGVTFAVRPPSSLHVISHQTRRY
jgi:hypothetical protein